MDERRYLTWPRALPLSYAVEHRTSGGLVVCIKYLLEYGARVDSVDGDGLTPMAYAEKALDSGYRKKERTEIIRLLREYEQLQLDQHT